MNPNLIATWLVGKIAGAAGLASLETRVFPDFAPEGTPNPCLVYQHAEDDDAEVLDAGAVEDGTIAFQVRMYADTRMGANALKEDFRRAFQNVAPVGLVDPVDGKPWRIDGTSFEGLPDTFDEETKDYGALGVVAVHVGC